MTDEQLNKIIAKRMAKQKTNVENLVKSYDERLLNAYQTALRQVKRELNYVKWRYGNNPTLVQYQSLTNKRDRISKIIKDLNDGSYKVINEVLKKAYSDTYYRTGFVLESSTGINLSFSIINENVVRHAVLNPLDKIKWNKRLKGWNTQLNDKIREELSSGLVSGQGIDRIASKIVSRVDIAFSRAQTIARTETHRVTCIARQDAFKTTQKAASGLGMKVQKRWISTLDTRTRDTHQELDGEYYDEENGGYYLESENRYIKGPGQGTIARDVINCRCTEISEIEGYELKSRLDNIEKEIIEYKTYKDWYKGRIAS